MCIASADDGEITFIGDRLDSSSVLGMFSIDFDRVKGGITFPERTVPERMGNDCRTVMLVSESNRFRRLKFSRICSGWGVWPYDEQVPFRRGYFDARKTRWIYDRLPAKEIVVRNRNPI
ncbi:hypothetical protein [Halorubrum sp. DTA98]|uniref:hypothetical protein n=1 Tax=Halorubrum sp. DTA98 TaxID=3402163 RepID=UPI003AAAC607